MVDLIGIIVVSIFLLYLLGGIFLAVHKFIMRKPERKYEAKILFVNVGLTMAIFLFVVYLLRNWFIYLDRFMMYLKL